MDMLQFILITSGAIALVGVVCGTALAVAARFFAVHEDPRIEKVAEILPGANCGGCGLAGCTEYARAIVVDGAAINLCAPGGNEVIEQIAAFLGREATAAKKMVALVLCGGNDTQAQKRHAYNGVADCTAAQAVNGGDKACTYGCLGYGSCSRICPVAAIEICDGLAKVHPELCISCGACVKVCPRNIIKMVPADAPVHVLCSSHDKGPVVKKMCKVGCIGCTLCTKQVENQAITMDRFLAVVDYSKETPGKAAAEKCPVNCIIAADDSSSDAQPEVLQNENN